MGAMHALRPQDHIVTHYRDHGHAIVRGLDPKRLMAELYGKETGVAKGRGGSMHFADATQEFLGRLCHRGGACDHRRRIGVGRAARQGRSRGDGVLRRRQHRQRPVLRMPESGRAVEIAGGVRVREQPVRHGRGDRQSLGRDGCAPQGAHGEHRIGAGRRHECAGRARSRAESGGICQQRQGPVLHRSAVLSLSRALGGRPRQVSRSRKDRRVEEARCDRARARLAGGAGPDRRRHRVDQRRCRARDQRDRGVCGELRPRPRFFDAVSITPTPSRNIRR